MLDSILEHKRIELLDYQVRENLGLVKRSFFQALKNPNRKTGLIAEVKKASPSKGVIKMDFAPESHALQYEKGRADCLSVLTDEKFFQGRTDYLSAIKRVSGLPVLRKDFIIDHRQVEESDHIGADAILLIGEAMEPSQLAELHAQAEEAGMDVLVEVHSTPVLEGILKVITPKLIGINNRDLRTFQTSIMRVEEFRDLVPEGSLIVSESGIHTPEDIETMRRYGADAVLVGEALMKEDDQEQAVRSLFGEVV